MKIYVASAFSKNNQGGNRAGVVIGEELTNQQKMKIAEKLGYSETAFITVNDQVSDFDYCLEYFTPVEEVPICGHATIASFIVLMNLGKITKNQYKIKTKAGILTITINRDTVFMEQNLPLYLGILSSEEIGRCIDRKALDKKYPIQIVSTGLKDILVPIDRLENLKSLKPNFEVMKEISKKHQVVGMHAFTLTPSEEATAVCRNFAPLYGIDEESATGTSNCALACYLFHYGIKQQQYIFEQGYELNNPSRIIVNIENDGTEITRVRVGGNGYLVETIEISKESLNRKN